MKIYIYIFLTFCLVDKLQAQNKTDTVYVRVYREDLSARFFTNHQNQLSIGFHFKVEWELHNFKRNDIFFYYRSPKKDGINGWSIFIKDIKDYLLFRNVFTLEEFTEALNNNEFLLPIANGKVQIIMLYGEKCSTKFEAYPVKVGTDLSSEG